MTFERFEFHGGHSVAVFVKDDLTEVRLNEHSLEVRIPNMIAQAPGYDPGPERAVLVELRRRNRKDAER